MPTSTLKEKAEERQALFGRMTAILDTASNESRELTAEERQEYDRLEGDLEAKGAEIEQANQDRERRERHRARAAELAQSRGRRTAAGEPGGAGDDLLAGRRNAGDPPAAGLNAEELVANIREVVAAGESFHEAISRIARQHVGSTRLAGLRNFISGGLSSLSSGEQAALQVDSDASGGTLVLPEEFVAQLIKAVDDRLFLRQLCTVLPLTNAESIGVPTLENDPADADWTSEVNIGGEDSTMSTGKRHLHPHPLGKLLKVSRTLLRKSVIPAEALVRDRLGYKFAVTQEKGFLTGNGSGQPLGLFAASDDGIPTSRDISTDNTATALTADGLINAKFGLKSQYMASPNTRWLFHRTAIREIRKLKDGDGHYLWQAGLAGTPDTILEVPYLMSEYVPNTFTASQYVGLIGDLTFYWIADSLRMELQRLNELYAATNQVGFIGRLECDGMPVLAEAFVRVQLAA